MGLDISVITNLKPATEADADVYLYTLDFPLSLDLDEGHYTGEWDPHGFKAGSYGGYNNYREKLAALGGHEADLHWDQPQGATDWPFHLQINFADNEGAIGPEASATLYAQYVAYDEKARQELGDWYEAYQDWKEAFRIASTENGAVIFG